MTALLSPAMGGKCSSKLFPVKVSDFPSRFYAEPDGGEIGAVEPQISGYEAGHAKFTVHSQLQRILEPEPTVSYLGRGQQ